MYDIIQDMLGAYQATPGTLQALLRNYSPEQAATSYGGEEDWSVVEIICHLRDSEEASLQRTRLMRDQDNPKLSVRDPVKLALELNYAGTSLDSALSAFLKLRQTHLQELKALTAEQWEHKGEHPFAGSITILGQLMHLVSHDAIHLNQISRWLTPSPKK